MPQASFKNAAQALLEETNGSVENAIARHFSTQSQDDQGEAEASASPRSALRAIVGSDGSDEQLSAMLQTAGGSVEAAVEAFLTDGLPAANTSSSRYTSVVSRVQASRYSGNSRRPLY